MRLLVIRHAIAEDREAFAQTEQPDSQRPLTRKGRKKMKRAVRGLVRVVPAIDVLATSPLVRAAQTAELVARRYDGVEALALEELAPERRPDELLGWLRSHDLGATVAVVGHEPHLNFLVGWLLTGRSTESFVEMRKGGAVLLDFKDPPTGGTALLKWSLSPKLLRRLGKNA